MEESNLILFFGRFHPLIVHLPIGFLMIGALMEIAERLSWLSNVRPAIIFSLLHGVASAVAASVLGYMLGTSGDYAPDMLDAHMWAGIITTVVAAAALLLKTRWVDFTKVQTQLYLGLLAVMMIAMSATGHLGGNMTHGSDYLTKYAPFIPKPVDPLARPKVTDIQQAQLFGDVVHPIIRDRCMSCHSSEKQKGKLSFSSIEEYLKGGESGDLIVAGDASASELFKRISLPAGHDDIMPPEGKEPLTEEQQLLIKFWIDGAGANFDTLLSQVEVPEEVMTTASHYLGLSGDEEQMLALDSIAPKDLEQLRLMGFEVRELAAGSYALDVTLPSGKANPSDIMRYLDTLDKVREHVIWLAMDESGLSDEYLVYFAGYPNLRSLKLSNNAITDAGIKQLSGLPVLEKLNLYGTGVTVSSMDHLRRLPALQVVYVWQTGIDEEAIHEWHSKHEKPRLVSGS
ncbi:c-type cytochrome domain-containing protein [Reichenbachiella agariperforans]|uniref:c-type cytochrome domain-containing protein n=1 Tax=Reichenbachiella agariperforans TaxID=156994 RepID=UPI001C0806B1|nr:c-type cytochrome domain-containing protein [Reichenbachiella agariperforans]MBU2912683.1 hypothetical protein [Reichenbachiella agariperforans]